MSNVAEIIEKLAQYHNADDAALLTIIKAPEDNTNALLAQAADNIRRQYYGDTVYIRGLIEFTNFCKNNCYYCGIRRDNRNVERYRLSEEEILSLIHI